MSESTENVSRAAEIQHPRPKALFWGTPRCGRVVGTGWSRNEPALVGAVLRGRRVARANKEANDAFT